MTKKQEVPKFQDVAISVAQANNLVQAYKNKVSEYPTEIKILAYALHAQGKSLRTIASSLGIKAHSTIADWVHQIELAPPAEAALLIQQIKKTMADKCYMTANRVSNRITDEDIEKASLVQKTTAIGTLIDKARLLEGKSNNNIEVHYEQVDRLGDEESRLKLEIEALEAELSD